MKNLLTKKPLPETADIDKSKTRPLSKSHESGSFARIEPVNPGKIPSSIKINRNLSISIIIILIIAVITTIFGVIPTYSTYMKGQLLIDSGRQLANALKNQDLQAAKQKIPDVSSNLQATKLAWNKIYLARVLPVISSYHQDGLHALNAAEAGVEATQITVEAIEPYADLLGLKAGSKFVTGSADERIQVAVKTMDKLTPKISEIGQKVAIIQKETDAINPQRYPGKLGQYEMQSQLVKAKQLVNDTTTLFLQAQPLLQALPEMLGSQHEKRYLILFQNDAELRPTGGFITAYAVFKVNQGKLMVEESDDIYKLDDRIQQKKPAPKEILTFHKGVYYFNIRDSNLSPDFAKSMQTFEELYPGKFDFDGVVTVDTHVLVESIKILGDFVVAGRTFSADIDKRCDCPKVIYELEDYATRPVAYVREARKDILGTLLLQIMQKALGVSPSQYWGQLFQMGISEINQKHILAYMKDKDAQYGVESFNMAGRIANDSQILGYQDGQGWDFLHINDANMAGAKSNLFVEHYINVDYQVDKDGSIFKAITITYKNPKPHSDCDLESGGLCLNALLRNWLRIYVPEGSQLIENKGNQSPKDGSQVDMTNYTDLGKSVFEGYTEVKPMGKAEVSLKYKLPFKKSDQPVQVLLQKQAGTDGHMFTITVNGKQKQEFALSTDKVITVKL